MARASLRFCARSSAPQCCGPARLACAEQLAFSNSWSSQAIKPQPKRSAFLLSSQDLAALKPARVRTRLCRSKLGSAQVLEAALTATGLPPLDLARPLASFSGGERTRLSIVRLLIDPPDVLLLDEPTNDLDDDGRAAIASLL